MVVVSMYKRGCDRCDKVVDVNSAVCVKKKEGYKHLCPACAKYLLKDITIRKVKKK